MKKKTVFQFLAALLCCFCLGCGAVVCLHVYDAYFDAPAPLSGGQTIDFSTYGFTLTVPDTYALNDYTTNHIAEGGDALFAGCAYGEGQELYLYCYANEQGDNMESYSEQEMVNYYTTAGAREVRMRTFGGRRFICYRWDIHTENGYETWDTYETWNEDIHLVFETRMNPWVALAILQTITFTPISNPAG